MNFKSLEIDLEHKVRKIQPLYEVIHINPSVEEKIICILKYREYEDCYYAMLQIRVEPLVIKTLKSSSLNKELNEVDEGTNNCFQVSVDKFNKIVRFGPIGNIMITPDELLGLGIGSYAFNKLIGWLKGKCPDFDVHNIEIAEVDAEIDSDKNRRNQFYTHHGFTPKYNDPTTEKSGYFCIEKVDRLKIHDIKNIEVKNIYEIMKTRLLPIKRKKG